MLRLLRNRYPGGWMTGSFSALHERWQRTWRLGMKSLYASYSEIQNISQALAEDMSLPTVLLEYLINGLGLGSLVKY